jgi:hypothetical protein
MAIEMPTKENQSMLCAECARYESARQVLALLIDTQRDKIRELEAERSACADLLAVIHRDGGHYAGQHGVVKAATDAIAIVHQLTAERDQYKKRADEYAQLATRRANEARKRV